MNLKEKKQNFKQMISIVLSIFMTVTILAPSISVEAIEEKDSVIIDVTKYGADPSGKKDSTVAIQKALEAAKKVEKHVTLNFPKGEYQFYKDYAQKREYHTSNTNSIENPIKTIGILIEEQKDLTIEGNDSLFIMHGNMMAVAIAKSENITLQNFAWDFEVPTTSEMTVKDIGTINGKNYVDYFIPSNFRYEIVDNNTNILWTSEPSPYTGEYYWSQKGHHNAWSVVIYNPETEISRRHSLGEGPFNGVNNIEKIGENIVRIKYNGAVPVGQTLGAVNEMCASSVRETAGAFIWESKDTFIKNVDVHYMHGFGWLTQMSENVTYDSVNFMPRVGTGKYTTSFADLIHVSGAAGKITIKNSNFSHAHDDPINIHGTFTRVEEKIDNRTLKLKYIHGQQGGFPQYYVGNEVTFFTRDKLMPSNNEEVMYNVVEASHPGEDGNDLRTMIVKFDKDLPEDIDAQIGNQPKYVAENVTYTPELEIVNNVFHTIPTRGILATTRKPVLIENNSFKNMSMASIFLSNDSDNWYESGPIRDMTIRGNSFEIVDTGQTEWGDTPPIYIHPVTLGGKLPSADTPIHKNIIIEDNEFYMDDERIITAESVENLTVKNNKIFRKDPSVELNISSNNLELNVGEISNINLESKGHENSSQKQGIMSFKACKNVVVEGNTYDDGIIKNIITNDMPEEYLNNNDDEISINGNTNASSGVSNVKFVSLNPEILEVSNDGLLKAKSTGEAKIIAYYMWNNTAIRSNELEFNITGEQIEDVENFEVITEDNKILSQVDETLQFEAMTIPSSFEENIKWNVKNIDNTDTNKATISENGLLTAKKSGVVLVTATLNGIIKSRVVVISLEEKNKLAERFDVFNRNDEKFNISSDTELNIIMEKGDLFNLDNNAKNIVLYDIPEELDKNNLRFSVKISNLPLSENNRWDSVGTYLYKDVNNYVSIGKKSHFNGVVSVNEKNAAAVETNSQVAVQESELIFDVYKNGENIFISYKTPNGEWTDFRNLTNTALNDGYKIGFAVWNHDGRTTEIKFSDFKVANGTEFNRDSILDLEPIVFDGGVNTKPSISNISLNRNEAMIGEEVSVSYDYLDDENNAEDGTIYRWDIVNGKERKTYFTTTNTFIPSEVGTLTCTIYPRDFIGSIGELGVSSSISINAKDNIGVGASDIKINGVTIDGFNIETLNYSYNSLIEQNNFILDILGNTVDSNILVKFNGKEILSGIGNSNGIVTVEEEGLLSIGISNNTVSKEYMIEVSKHDYNDSKISSISIDELDFNVNDTLKKAYTLDTNYNTKEITIKATSDEKVSSVKLYATEYRSEVPNKSLIPNQLEATVKLKAGNNLFYIDGIAKDGITKTRHIINIIRGTNSVTTLDDIKLNGESIDGFEANKFDYFVRLANDVTKLNIETISSNDSLVSVRVNGKFYEGLNPDIELSNGLNSIIIVVKGDDLWTNSYYEIKAIVQSDTNSKLLSLATDDNILNPMFKEDIFEYNITTNKQEFSLNAIAQEVDANIELTINNKVFNGKGEITGNIKLIAGYNTALVKVISKDGTISEYRVNINAEESVYLSDLNWEAQSTVGYGSIMRDTNPNGGEITILKDNTATKFKKGIGAHAPSTLIFNIEGKGYEKFETYVGVDYSQANTQYGHTTFKILLDGIETFNSGEVTGSSESNFVSLDIKNVKEIKLVAKSGVNNWNDHAVWADAKFEKKFDSLDENIVVSKVQNLKAENITNNSLNLKWDAPKDLIGLVGFDIYKDGKIFTTVDKNTTEILIDGLKKNSIYNLKIVSKYSNGNESRPVSKSIRTLK